MVRADHPPLPTITFDGVMVPLREGTLRYDGTGNASFQCELDMEQDADVLRLLRCHWPQAEGAFGGACPAIRFSDQTLSLDGTRAITYTFPGRLRFAPHLAAAR